ncbi:MAG: hypothetical protein Q4B48_03535 [Syntrophomonadaceae bacterium]|nr:hypothetical protein [Syntrophomonadaceae bacterium]
MAPILLIALIIGLSLLVVFGTQSKASEEGIRLTEQAVIRAAVQCYALEGFYPQQLSYLKDHYGVSYNEDSYTVHYQYIASNLMPDITVLVVE